MCGTGGDEIVVVGVARVCDGGSRFLEAENVYRMIASIFEYGGEVVRSGNIVGA